jgi:hypothetical protein
MTRDLAVEEKVADLFQPDVLTPSQFFDRLRRRSEHDGERRLMIAVLEDAIDVFRKRAGSRDRRGRQMFEEAEAWIEGTDRSWLYAFENVCDVLGIDAEYLRGGLRKLKARTPATVPAQVIPLHPVIDDELRRAGAN